MLSLMNERQLRHSLALWTMKNSRFAPQPGSCEEAAFIKTYAVPQTRFERVNSAVSSNGRPLSIFRTVIRLADCSRAAGRNARWSISRQLRRTRTASATLPRSLWAIQ